MFRFFMAAECSQSLQSRNNKGDKPCLYLFNNHWLHFRNFSKNHKSSVQLCACSLLFEPRNRNDKPFCLLQKQKIRQDEQYEQIRKHNHNQRKTTQKTYTKIKFSKKYSNQSLTGRKLQRKKRIAFQRNNLRFPRFCILHGTSNRKIC